MEKEPLAINADQVVQTANVVQSKLSEKIKSLERELADLRQSEAVLRTSEAKWREVLQNSPDIIAIVDRGLKLEYINHTIPEIDVNGMIGTSVLEYILPAYHDLVKERNNHVLETGEVVQFETEGMGANGITAWYSSRLGPFKVNDEVKSVVHIVTDITEQKQAQNAARTNERRFHDLIEHAPLCIFEIDTTHLPAQILIANRRAELLYGWSSGQFSSLPLSEIFSPHTINRSEKLVACGNRRKPLYFESEHVRRDGSTFPVRISATPEVVDGNRRMIVIVEDISAEKERRSEIDALDEERRRIAHEIHDGLAQNLAALRLQAALWHDLLQSDPEKMHKEIEHLLTALKSYIREVRRSIFALSPIALDELTFFPALREFLTLFNQTYAVQTHLEVSGSEERLPVSLELPLFRILQEALNNVGRHAQARKVWIELELSGQNNLDLMIRDDGIGFDPAAPEKLVQAEHFGLKHMRERVESFGGTFFIKSEIGIGSEIRVMLPLNNR